MKKLLSLMLALFMAAALFAGGKQDAGGPKVVRIWTNDAHDRDEYEQLVAEFNSTIGAQKGIKIEYTCYGGDYNNVLDVAIDNGEEPEIFKSPKTAQYVQQGKIMPIDDLPGLSEVINQTKQYNMESWNMFDGKVYAVPIRVSNFNMVYNKTLFAKAGIATPPRTWDELIDAAKKVTAAGEGQAFGFALPMTYGAVGEGKVMLPNVPSTGYFHFDWVKQEYRFRDIKGYIEVLLKMIEDKSMHPNFQSMDDDQVRATFAQGNIGMFFAGSSDVGVIFDQFKGTVDWAVVEMPVRDLNNHYKRGLYPNPWYAVSSKVKSKGLTAEVAEIYKFFLSDHALEVFYTAGKDIPVRGAEVTSKAKAPARVQFVQFSDLATGINRRPFPEASFAIEGDTYNTVITRILNRQVGIDEGLADLDRRYNAAYQKAISDGVIKASDFSYPQWTQNNKWPN